MVKTAKEAAEIAADYIYHLYDDLGGDENDGINHACELYQMITGEEMDVEGILGVPFDNDENYDEY